MHNIYFKLFAVHDFVNNESGFIAFVVVVLFFFAPCKGIQDRIGFWIPCHGFCIPGNGFYSYSVELGFWIPIVCGIPEFCELYSGFQSQGFRIAQAKFSRISDSTNKNFPDLGIRIPSHRFFFTIPCHKFNTFVNSAIY